MVLLRTLSNIARFVNGGSNIPQDLFDRNNNPIQQPLALILPTTSRQDVIPPANSAAPAATPNLSQIANLVNRNTSIPLAAISAEQPRLSSPRPTLGARYSAS